MIGVVVSPIFKEVQIDDSNTPTPYNYGSLEEQQSPTSGQPAAEISSSDSAEIHHDGSVIPTHSPEEISESEDCPHAESGGISVKGNSYNGSHDEATEQSCCGRICPKKAQFKCDFSSFCDATFILLMLGGKLVHP